MPESSFGAQTKGSGFSGAGTVSVGTLVSARACSDGTRPMLITHLYGAASGRGASRTLVIYLGGSSAGISVAAAGSAQVTGWIDTSDWLTWGGTAVSYGYSSPSGSYYFSRDATGAGSTTDGTTTWSGALGMYYRYIECPSAPTVVSVVPSADGSSATVTLSAPADNGGGSVTGYRVQRATNAGFTTGLATVDSGTSVVMTGLTPGVTYYYRATARNAATDAAGKLGGVWSSAVSQAQPDPDGFGRRYSGTIFETSDARVRDPADSAWVTPEMRRYSGLVWEPAGS